MMDLAISLLIAILPALPVFLILLWFTRSPQKLSSVLFWFTLAEIVFVILYFTARTNNIVILKDIAAQVIGYTMILLWLARERSGFRLAPTPMNMAVLVFFLASVFSALTTAAQFRHAALIRLSLPVSVILTFWVIVNFFHTRRRWFAGVLTLQGLMVMTAVYSIMQERGYDFMSWGRIVNVSTFGNSQFFASFLSYMAPLSIFLMLGAKEWTSRIVYLAFAVLCIGVLVHIKMRVGYLGLILLGILLVYFEMRFGRIRRLLGTRPWRRVGWAAVFVLSMIFFTAYPSSVRQTFEYIFYDNEVMHSIRTLRMTGGVMMGWDRPLVGHGIGTFHAVFPYYRDGQYHRVGLSHNSDSPASQLVTLFGEQGLLGMSAFIAVLVVFFICMIRHIRKTQDVHERYIGFGVLAAVLCGWTADSIGHSYLWMTSMLTFWVLLGLGTRWMMGLEEPPAAPAADSADSAPSLVPAAESELSERETPVDASKIETPAPVSSQSPLRHSRESGNPVRVEMGLDARRSLPPNGLIGGGHDDQRTMDTPQVWVYLSLTCVFLFMFWAHARVLLGDRLLKKCEESNGKEAITLCRMALEAQPYAHSGYYKLAFHHLNENTNEGLERALRQYHQLLMIAPNYAQTHQNTGLIHYRKYANTGQKKYLYQSILEFEWSTLLENNSENHTKLLQLYTQLCNDSARGRYHNQFLWWNAREDAFFNLTRYWNVAGDPDGVESDRQDVWDEWVIGLRVSAKDYWLYRTDTVRRIGRPADDIRYAMKMAVQSAPDHSGLLQYAIGSLLASGQESDFMYLADILEDLQPGVLPEDVLSQARSKLTEWRRLRLSP